MMPPTRNGKIDESKVGRRLLLDLRAAAAHRSGMNRGRRKAAARPAAPRGSDPIVLSVLGTAHALEARLEGALGRVGLSLAKLGLLQHLAAAGGSLALPELAEPQACVPSHINPPADRLEKDRPVPRRTD